MRDRFAPTAIILILLVLGALAAIGSSNRVDRLPIPSGDREAIRTELSALTFPAYAAQKVVYHINRPGGRADHDYISLLHSMDNHIAAVGADKVEMRVVLQGSGLGLLANAAAVPELKSEIDGLRGKGVKFLVCRNSLIDAAIEPSRLYGVTNADIVPAAVAEIADLEGKGFAYIHP
jgi:intracellular sulfur oxidation DsrE/DsrF family protein